MALTDLVTAVIRSEPGPGPKPRDEELDLFGLTHPGNVRKENQDHFLLATVHQQIVIHATSLPGSEELPLRGQRLGTVLLVADGVGGGAAGGEASQIAVAAIMRYVTSTMRCFHASGRSAEKEFLEALRTAALEAHDAVRAEAASRGPATGARPGRRMATTLTLALAVWPFLYVVQVGDSRCYYYWDGTLRQVTRDQTVAQDLLDQGALSPEQAAASPFSSVLASAIGGEEAMPEVTRLDISNRGCVILLCSDGLTKHVANDEITEHLRAMTSSEQLCRGLLELALQRGGTDNITVLAGRAPVAKAGAPA